MADAQHLPQGRHQAGDRHLKFYETRDNLRRYTDLVSKPGLVAIVTLDRGTHRVLNCRFLNRPGV